MDWITFIKWNGIAYATYYGANFLVDYLRTSGKLAKKTDTIEYSLNDLGIEKPQVVRASDFQSNNEKTRSPKENKASDNNHDQQMQISFDAPIERQAIPINEYIKIAAKSGNQIFQPTI